MASKVLIIDICGTLYQSNTTFDFIKFHFSTKRRYKIIGLLRNNCVICKLNHIFFKLTGCDIMRMELIQLLCGYSKNELSKKVSEFYVKYLLPRKNLDCFEVIERYRNKGAQLILVSATLDIIADEVSKMENIPFWAASKLLFEAGRCKGDLGCDLLKGKLEKTLELTGGISFDVITDNYGDADIIRASKHAYLVQYNNKRDKWARYLNQNTLMKCEYIRI